VAGAAQRLAIYLDRPAARPALRGSGHGLPGIGLELGQALEPRASRGGERGRIQPFQHITDGRLVRHLVNARQRVVPNTGTSSTPAGTSATHSAIAANDLAPASTTATAVASTDANECRTPRGSRRSGTHARYAMSCGILPASTSRSAAGSTARSPRTAQINDDAGAGTVFSCDQGSVDNDQEA
jgi:hypothetical protein